MDETGLSTLGRWEPLSPSGVAALFASLTVSWWIAGGWALDLFLGQQTRIHDDIDVQVLRRDQHHVRTALTGWDVQAALPPPRSAAWPFREWRCDETLDPPIHDVWCRPHRDTLWALQLMIGESTEDEWLFRRDPRIRRSVSKIGRRTRSGIPYLAPEIQLLYKAKAPRTKDEADFRRVVPHLNGKSRRWLREALTLLHPGHPWIDVVSG